MNFLKAKSVDSKCIKRYEMHFPVKFKKISFPVLAEYKKSSIFATLLEKGIHNPN